METRVKNPRVVGHYSSMCGYLGGAGVSASYLRMKSTELTHRFVVHTVR